MTPERNVSLNARSHSVQRTDAGAARDQTALYGLIDKARDLGLTLLAVGATTPAARPDSAVQGPHSNID